MALEIERSDQVDLAVLATLGEPTPVSPEGLGQIEKRPGAMVIDARAFSEIRKRYRDDYDPELGMDMIRSGRLGFFRERLLLVRRVVPSWQFVLVDDVPGTWMRVDKPVLSRDGLSITARLYYEFGIEPGSVRLFEVEHNE